MKSLLILVFILLPVLASGQQVESETSEHFPQQMSGKKLLNSCASSAMTSAGRERRKYCWGFVSGVEEAMRHLNTSLSLEVTICVPERTSARTLADAYVRFAANKQRELNGPAAELVRQALIAAFPCPSAGQP